MSKGVFALVIVALYVFGNLSVITWLTLGGCVLTVAIGFVTLKKARQENPEYFHPNNGGFSD